MAQDDRQSRIDCLDALRGICALGVALFHFETTGALTNAAFFQNGWMLVDFFFVLSGFVITSAYAQKLHEGYSISHFLFLRLARIWPLHAFMLLCFLGLELSKLVVQMGAPAPLFAPPREPGSFLVNVLLLQVFGLYDHLTWNAPSWSIAAEFWVYIIAAVLFRLVQQRIALFIVIAVSSGLAMAMHGAPFLNLAHDGGVIRCLYGFSIGALAWSAFVHAGGRRASPPRRSSATPMAWTLLEATVLGSAIAAIIFSDRGIGTLAMPPLFGICVLVVARQQGHISALLGRTGPVWLGSISYSIYMTHAFVEGRVLDALTLAGRLLNVTMVERTVVHGAAARVVVGSELFTNLVSLAVLILIIALASISYRLIEQPCNRWARSRLQRVRPSMELAAAS